MTGAQQPAPRTPAEVAASLPPITRDQAQRLAVLLKGRPAPEPTPEQRAEERAKRDAIRAEMQQGLHDLEVVMAEQKRQEREEQARYVAEYEAKQAESGESDE